MLRKINYALLSIAILLGVLCIGFSIYYKQVDVSKSSVIQNLEGTLHPTGGF